MRYFWLLALLFSVVIANLDLLAVPMEPGGLAALRDARSELCANCHETVRENCLLNITDSCKVNQIGKSFMRCKEVNLGGQYCKDECECGQDTDYCNENLECFCVRDDPTRCLHRCTEDRGGPACNVTCKPECNKQCSLPFAYNTSVGMEIKTENVSCDQSFFLCNQTEHSWYFFDNECKHSCPQTCDAMCIDLHKDGHPDCYPSYNTSNGLKCKIGYFGANCKKCKCNPESICNYVDGSCECPIDNPQCKQCGEGTWGPPDCTQTCPPNCGQDAECRDYDGACRCRLGIPLSSCRRCLDGWDGPKCDETLTTTISTTTTEIVPSSTETTTTEEPTTITSPAYPECNDTDSQKIHPPSYCRQKEVCGEEDSNSECVPLKNDCILEDNKEFYCSQNSMLTVPSEWGLITAITVLGALWMLILLMLGFGLLFWYRKYTNLKEKLERGDSFVSGGQGITEPQSFPKLDDPKPPLSNSPDGQDKVNPIRPISQMSNVASVTGYEYESEYRQL